MDKKTYFLSRGNIEEIIKEFAKCKRFFGIMAKDIAENLFEVRLKDSITRYYYIDEVNFNKGKAGDKNIYYLIKERIL